MDHARENDTRDFFAHLFKHKMDPTMGGMLNS